MSSRGFPLQFIKNCTVLNMSNLTSGLFHAICIVDPATDCTKGDVSKPVAVDSAKSIVNSLAQFHSQVWVFLSVCIP